MDEARQSEETHIIQAGNGHIQCVIDRLPPELASEQRKRAVEFVERNAAVFSKSEFDLGCTGIVKHSIDTGDNRPFKQQLRHPMALLPLIENHVDEMLRSKIIEPTVSLWASNVVLIRKSDDSYRFCID